MEADRGTTARRPVRAMALLTIMALRDITTLKRLAVRRVTILRSPLVHTRRRRYALLATCGSTVITESMATVRCLLIAALTGSGRATMADASSPVTGVAHGASSVAVDSTVVWASPATMTFVAAPSAAELSPGTISVPGRWADRALRGTTVSVAGRKARNPSVVGRASTAARRACDLPAGSLAAEERAVRVADTPVEDTDK